MRTSEYAFRASGGRASFREKNAAQQVFFLHRGELIEQGKADIVLSKPSQAETKQFLDFYGMYLNKGELDDGCNEKGILSQLPGRL